MRVSNGEVTKLTEKLHETQSLLEVANSGIEKRDNVISHQMQRVEELSKNLKDSVKKTRELRSELSERATENLKSTMKIREVETELEVAQASTDMIATGVLDYSFAPDPEEGENDPDITQAAT